MNKINHEILCILLDYIYKPNTVVEFTTAYKFEQNKIGTVLTIVILSPSCAFDGLSSVIPVFRRPAQYSRRSVLSNLLLPMGHLKIFKHCAGRKPVVNSKGFIFAGKIYFILGS